MQCCSVHGKAKWGVVHWIWTRRGILGSEMSISLLLLLQALTILRTKFSFWDVSRTFCFREGRGRETWGRIWPNASNEGHVSSASVTFFVYLVPVWWPAGVNGCHKHWGRLLCLHLERNAFSRKTVKSHGPSEAVWLYTGQWKNSHLKARFTVLHNHSEQLFLAGSSLRSFFSSFSSLSFT